MSTDKENAKNGAMEVEDTSNDESPSIPNTDSKGSDESSGKFKEKDVRRKLKGKESKKESKDVDGSSVKEGKAAKVVKDESESDEENEKDDGKVPLLDQPLELSGTRERKKVQRFSEEYKTEIKDTSPVEIPEGKGIQLGNIPHIEATLQRTRPDDLKPLHRILFNRVGKATSLKKNIRKFSGFDFDEDSDHYAKKKQTLLKFEVRLLRVMCTVLDIKKSLKREEIVDNILNFLMKPVDSGKPAGKPRPKRAARSNNKSYSESDDDEDERKTSRRKTKRANTKEESEDEDDLEEKEEKDDDDDEDEENDKDVQDKAKKERKNNDSEKDTKDIDSDQGDDDDDDDDDEDAKDEDEGSSDDSDEPKSKSKKASRSTKNNKQQSAKKANSKKPAPKKEKKQVSKKRVKSDGESSEDEPLVKKTKAPPSDDEIRTYVKEILEGANLEETTMKIVCKQVYAHYPDFDLSHKKDFIKSTVKSLIST